MKRSDSSWTAFDSGLGGLVKALTTIDEDGNGPNPEVLYAGGIFTTADGMLSGRIAKWSRNPLAIGAQTGSQFVCSGESAEFSVDASGGQVAVGAGDQVGLFSVFGGQAQRLPVITFPGIFRIQGVVLTSTDRGVFVLACAGERGGLRVIQVTQSR